MAYKLLYIDDDSLDRITGTIKGFSKDGILEIIASKPLDSLEKQVEDIEKRVKNEEINGLILDLRLDDYKNENGNKVQFRGTTLAQEIRTRQREGGIIPFPIFLFSGNDKITESLSTVAKNSFDICIEKETINEILYGVYRKHFCSIIEGYNTMIQEDDIYKALAITTRHCLNEQFLSDIAFYREQSKTIMSFIHFMIYEVLKKDGVLISEELLAARLGIDIKKSEDWKNVITILDVAKYKGIMSSAWERWWMSDVENWWKDQIDSDNSLQCLNAESRVSKLKDKFNLTNLIVANKIDKCNGTEYWTLCAANNRPLDPIDGLTIINQDNLYLWQDVEYVSIECALRRNNIDKWHGVSKMEEIRLEELTELHAKKR